MHKQSKKCNAIVLLGDFYKKYIQGASGKSVLFLNACIYPCNGRTRLSKVPLETYRSQEEFDVFHVSIGHSELWLERFEWWEANFFERHFHAPTPLFAPLNFFLLQFLRFPVINIPFIGIRQKEFLNFIEKHGRYELLNVKNCFFLGGGVNFWAFSANWQFWDTWKKYLKMIWTPFLFSSLLSILSNGENNDLEDKSSHLPYILAPQK